MKDNLKAGVELFTTVGRFERLEWDATAGVLCLTYVVQAGPESWETRLN